MIGVTASSRWQSLADKHEAGAETNRCYQLPARCRMKSNEMEMGKGRRIKVKLKGLPLCTVSEARFRGFWTPTLQGTWLFGQPTGAHTAHGACSP